MRRPLITTFATVALLGVSAGTAACTPPPAVESALCVKSPTTGTVFGTRGSGCGGVDVDELCGPMIPSLTTADECIALVRQGAGPAVIVRRSSMVPGDVMTGGPYR